MVVCMILDIVFGIRNLGTGSMYEFLCRAVQISYVLTVAAGLHLAVQNLNNISKHHFAVCREGRSSYSPTSHHISQHFSHSPLRPWKKEDLSITD